MSFPNGSPGTERLDPGQVRVFALAVPEAYSKLPIETRTAAKVLSPWELVRFERYRPQRRRNDLVLSRALLRIALDWLGLAGAEPPRLEADPRGKPSLCLPPGDRPLHVNISDTAGMILWAFTRVGPVGCDVEMLCRDHDGVAETHFAVPELAAWRALAGPPRTRRFHELWTCKEAVMKADGRGLGLPLDSFSITVPDGSGDGLAAVEVLDPVTGPAPGPWQLRRFRPGPDHQAAVALRGLADVEFRCHAVRLAEADPEFRAPWTFEVSPDPAEAAGDPEILVFHPTG